MTDDFAAIYTAWKASLTERQRRWLVYDPATAICVRKIRKANRRGLRSWIDLPLRLERVRTARKALKYAR